MFKKLLDKATSAIAGKENVALIKFASGVVDSVNDIVNQYRNNKDFMETFIRRIESRLQDETKPKDELASLAVLKEMFSQEKGFNLLQMEIQLKNYNSDDVLNAVKSILNVCTQAYYEGNQQKVSAADPVIVGLRALEGYVKQVSENKETGAAASYTVPTVRSSDLTEPITFKSSDEACESIKHGLETRSNLEFH